MNSVQHIYTGFGGLGFWPYFSERAFFLFKGIGGCFDELQNEHAHAGGTRKGKKKIHAHTHETL